MAKLEVGLEGAAPQAQALKEEELDPRKTT